MRIGLIEAKKRIAAILKPHMNGKEPDFYLMTDPEFGKGMHCGNRETYDAGQIEYDKVMAIVNDCLD